MLPELGTLYIRIHISLRCVYTDHKCNLSGMFESVTY